MTDEQRERGLRLFARHGKGCLWTRRQRAWLREVYPDTPCPDIAEVVGVQANTIRVIAGRRGLRKSEAGKAAFRAVAGRKVSDNCRKARRNLKWGIFGEGYHSEDFRRLSGAQSAAKSRMARDFGYKVIHDRWDQERKFCVYYTPETRRRPKSEATCGRLGLRVLPWEGEE
ncbi:MAG: hypothetical protein LUC33_00630 [Prevotellaceae bacterium]|nr:hypothetical protein [Prevotellaceae bacterium]